jgi:hypothetical protein
MPNIPPNVEASRAMARFRNIRAHPAVEHIELEVPTRRAEESSSNQKEDSGGQNEEHV